MGLLLHFFAAVFIFFAFIMGDPVFAYCLVSFFCMSCAVVFPVPGRLCPCLFVDSFWRLEPSSLQCKQLGAGRTTKGSKESLFKKLWRKAGGQ